MVSFQARSPRFSQKHLKRKIAEAHETIARAEAELRRAEAVIETHDRPLRRKKHEYKIQMARRELHRQPEVIRQADAAIASAETKMTKLGERSVEATEVLGRRPDLESKVAAIDDRLARDLRVRMRVVRFEQPTEIVETIGPRPQRTSEAPAWDLAAARLHQQQAALDDRDGIDPLPRRLGHAEGRDATESLTQPIHRPRPTAIAPADMEVEL